ncbi:hypothetical protein [Actinoplanes derwentensis]|uniref:Zinc-finger n=1 Tax=Actinoplanes derwentensis TaxID=113562 RepID=A0A1H2CT79_9ACTN|nr:hypothetical protein [Actinoplanes derwentensis]GID90158.1 hypothetical protein Ade03nite_90820 [Actinoplanes derwentensis]SDT73564.1 hypothetical protein SAMN04489716_6708 [Actinoplanes derwentensis]
MTAEWHVDSELREQYEHGVLEPSRVMAVEAHMLACATCRGEIPADITWLTGNFSVVYDDIHAPKAGPAQRLLTRFGLPEHRFRLLTATPALRWSWLVATFAVLGLAAAASLLFWAGDDGMASRLFLILAPILPVIAVSGAYGPAVDPMHEITGTTPSAGPSLVLWRAISVISVATVMTAVAGFLLPGSGWLAAGWLLPALLLCTGTLALATALSLPVAAGVLGGLWLIGVLAVYQAQQEIFVSTVFGPPAQFTYLATAVVAAAVLFQRRGRFDLGESR